MLFVGVAVCLDFDHFGLLLDAVCWLLVLVCAWILIIFGLFLDAVCWLLVLLFAWILINFGYLSLLFAVYGSCCLLGL